MNLIVNVKHHKKKEELPDDCWIGSQEAESNVMEEGLQQFEELDLISDG